MDRHYHDAPQAYTSNSTNVHLNLMPPIHGGGDGGVVYGPDVLTFLYASAGGSTPGNTSTVNAGTAYSLTIQANLADVNGNTQGIDTGYSGTLNFNSTDPLATFQNAQLQGLSMLFPRSFGGKHTFSGVVWNTVAFRASRFLEVMPRRTKPAQMSTFFPQSKRTRRWLRRWHWRDRGRDRRRFGRRAGRPWHPDRQPGIHRSTWLHHRRHRCHI